MEVQILEFPNLIGEDHSELPAFNPGRFCPIFDIFESEVEQYLLILWIFDFVDMITRHWQEEAEGESLIGFWGKIVAEEGTTEGEI